MIILHFHLLPQFKYELSPVSLTSTFSIVVQYGISVVKDSNNLELLNKHVLRIVFNNKASTYDMLLESLGLDNLKERRLLKIC